MLLIVGPTWRAELLGSNNEPSARVSKVVTLGLVGVVEWPPPLAEIGLRIGPTHGPEIKSDISVRRVNQQRSLSSCLDDFEQNQNVGRQAQTD